jgi:acyl dehydratase
MPINYEKLMAYPIPEIRQAYTAQDTAFYALSCGLGADPLDPRQLDFVDFDRTMKVLPSMPVVLGYPGVFMRDPGTGIDALKAVHGEQEVRILRPLPPAATIIGRSRITALIDKGEGRGALMVTARDIVDAASGQTLAVSTATAFLRGDGGFGGPAGPGPVPAPHPLPERAADFAIDLPTRPEQALYYRLNGDDNPLHADPGFAARAGFARPILHGLCTMGVVTHALLRGLCDYDPAQVAAIKCRFSAPVFPGETIRTEIWRDGSFRALVAARGAVVVNNGLLERRSQEQRR